METTGPIGPVRFSAYEIRRLVVLIQPQPPYVERIQRGLAWSFWRRLHQAVARTCHRRRNRAREAGHPTARPPPTTPRTTAKPLISN